MVSRRLVSSDGEGFGFAVAILVADRRAIELPPPPTGAVNWLAN
jgi:hypothetical protein